jgi:myosin heavy subunit
LITSIYQAANERNFHIFYQLCAGADDATRQRMLLPTIECAASFRYCNQGGKSDVQGIDDVEEYAQTRAAMKAILAGSDGGCGISVDEQIDHVFECLAAVMHIGQVSFRPGEDGDTGEINIYIHCCLCALFISTHRCGTYNRYRFSPHQRPSSLRRTLQSIRWRICCISIPRNYERLY